MSASRKNAAAAKKKRPAWRARPYVAEVFTCADAVKLLNSTYAGDPAACLRWPVFVEITRQPPPRSTTRR